MFNPNKAGEIDTNIIQGGYPKAVRLHNDNPCLVAKMLKYCYSEMYDDYAHEYQFQRCNAHRYVSQLHCNASMHALAIKYSVETLKATAEFKFEVAINLTSVTPAHIEKVIEIIPLVYKDAPDGDYALRDLVLDFAYRNSEAIRSHPKFTELQSQGDSTHFLSEFEEVAPLSTTSDGNGTES